MAPPMQPTRLPKKKDVALQLLEQATVFVHLDPRADSVHVPAWFKRQPQLVLQVGLNMAVPIPDLDVNEEGLSCTLSFNRSPFYCVIPWGAVFALVGENRQGMIWPDDIPAEVQAQAAAQQAKQTPKPELRVAPAPVETPAPPAPEARAAKPKRGKAAAPAARAATKTTRAATRGTATKRTAAATPAAAKPARAATPKTPAAAKRAVAKGARPAAAKSAAKGRPVEKAAPAPAPAAKAPVPAAKAPVPAPAAKAPAAKAPALRAAPVAATESRAAAAGAGKRKLPPYLRVVK